MLYGGGTLLLVAFHSKITCISKYIGLSGTVYLYIMLVFFILKKYIDIQFTIILLQARLQQQDSLWDFVNIKTKESPIWSHFHKSRKNTHPVLR